MAMRLDSFNSTQNYFLMMELRHQNTQAIFDRNQQVIFVISLLNIVMTFIDKNLEDLYMARVFIILTFNCLFIIFFLTLLKQYVSNCSLKHFTFKTDYLSSFYLSIVLNEWVMNSY